MVGMAVVEKGKTLEIIMTIAESPQIKEDHLGIIEEQNPTMTFFRKHNVLHNHKKIKMKKLI
jgi:hypothetical protein